MCSFPNESASTFASIKTKFDFSEMIMVEGNPGHTPPLCSGALLTEKLAISSGSCVIKAQSASNIVSNLQVMRTKEDHPN